VGKFVYKKGRSFDLYWGSGTYIQRAISKHGKENFKKEIIQEVDNVFGHWGLNAAEKYWIKEFQARERGYNISPGGLGGFLSKESREKRSKALKDPNHPIHLSRRNHKLSREVIEHQVKARQKLYNSGKYGKPTLTDEQRQRYSEHWKWVSEQNKLNPDFKKQMGEVNRRPEKIEKQRQKMIIKGAPHLAKTFIFENVKTGEKQEVTGGFQRFCKEKELHEYYMQRILHNKRSEPEKGWIVYYPKIEG